MEEALLFTIHGRMEGMGLALRAVLFDYGMVLSCWPDPAAIAAMLSITGLSREQLERLYCVHRPAYDLGDLTGEEFWRRIARDARAAWSDSAIDELVRWDARMWMTVNPAMLDWQLALKQSGLRTAIVSNMGDTVREAMEREFAWLARFDALVWSHQLRRCKPDPEIYRDALDKLGIQAEEALFLDDRPENVEAAVALGMTGICFSTVEELRAELIARGLDEEIPLPE